MTQQAAAVVQMVIGSGPDARATVLVLAILAVAYKALDVVGHRSSK